MNCGGNDAGEVDKHTNTHTPHTWKSTCEVRVYLQYFVESVSHSGAKVDIVRVPEGDANVRHTEIPDGNLAGWRVPLKRFT